jgi:hypothetical protein
VSACWMAVRRTQCRWEAFPAETYRPAAHAAEALCVPVMAYLATALSRGRRWESTSPVDRCDVACV